MPNCTRICTCKHPTPPCTCPPAANHSPSHQPARPAERLAAQGRFKLLGRGGVGGGLHKGPHNSCPCRRRQLGGLAVRPWLQGADGPDGELFGFEFPGAAAAVALATTTQLEMNAMARKTNAGAAHAPVSPSLHHAGELALLLAAAVLVAQQRQALEVVVATTAAQAAREKAAEARQPAGRRR